jgi:hypothetical protein
MLGCARSWWAAALTACSAGGGLVGLGWKGRWRENKRKRFFKFSNSLKQMNSNKGLNSNTQNNAPACMQQGIPILHYLIKKK